MATLDEQLNDLVHLLRSNGIHATTDPRNLAPPCAWVTVSQVTAPYLGGNLQVSATVALITGDSSTPLALRKLGAMLDTLAELITFDTPVVPVTLTPPGVAPLPALATTTVL